MSFSIENRPIGPGHPAYIVAELSANHGGDYARAVGVIEAAARAGADAVKLQTYTADTLTIPCAGEPFTIRGTRWNGRTLHDLYREAHTPWDWHAPLQAVARQLGLHCFSSPFDASAVAFLDTLDMPAFKIASFEIVDIPLLREVGRRGKPVILSTGMATLDEIAEAVRTLREEGLNDLALLKCTSGYPADPGEMHLRTIPDLSRRFGVPVGLSDHTLDLGVPAAAVALGASIVEKHLTLDRGDGGPDSGFSLEPEEFAAMVQTVRTVERALGDVHYGPSPHERASLAFRRSLFVVKAVRAGETFSRDNIRSIRPANGLHPRHLEELIGRRAAVDLAPGTPLDWALVDRG